MESQSVRELELEGGIKALVDAEDYNRVSFYPLEFSKNIEWRIQEHNGRKMVILYPSNRSKRERIYLHHFVLGLSDDQSKARVKFLNGNTLDCRKENLVYNKNRCAWTSDIKFRESDQTWASYVSFDPTLVGRFSSEVEATEARNEVRIAIIKVLTEFKNKFNRTPIKLEEFV
jgi:hypothetical protein